MLPFTQSFRGVQFTPSTLHRALTKANNHSMIEAAGNYNNQNPTDENLLALSLGPFGLVAGMANLRCQVKGTLKENGFVTVAQALLKANIHESTKGRYLTITFETREITVNESQGQVTFCMDGEELQLKSYQSIE